jgi:hypothetical protein
VVASLLAFAILFGVSGFRQPGGIRETGHALRGAWSGLPACGPIAAAAIGHEDDDPSPDRARRTHEPARKRPRSVPAAVGEPAESLALRAPAADAHLLAAGTPVPVRGRDVVAGLRGRAPPRV